MQPTQVRPGKVRSVPLEHAHLSYLSVRTHLHQYGEVTSRPHTQRTAHAVHLPSAHC